MTTWAHHLAVHPILACLLLIQNRLVLAHLTAAVADADADAVAAAAAAAAVVVVVVVAAVVVVAVVVVVVEPFPSPLNSSLHPSHFQQVHLT